MQGRKRRLAAPPAGAPARAPPVPLAGWKRDRMAWVKAGRGQAWLVAGCCSGAEVVVPTTPVERPSRPAAAGWLAPCWLRLGWAADATAAAGSVDSSSLHPPTPWSLRSPSLRAARALLPPVPARPAAARPAGARTTGSKSDSASSIASAAEPATPSAGCPALPGAGAVSVSAPRCCLGASLGTTPLPCRHRREHRPFSATTVQEGGG